MPLRPNKTPLFISLLSPCNMQDDFDHIVSWFIFKRWRHSWKPLSYSIVCSNKKTPIFIMYTWAGPHVGFWCVKTFNSCILLRYNRTTYTVLYIFVKMYFSVLMGPSRKTPARPEQLMQWKNWSENAEKAMYWFTNAFNHESFFSWKTKL